MSASDTSSSTSTSSESKASESIGSAQEAMAAAAAKAMEKLKLSGDANEAADAKEAPNRNAGEDLTEILAEEAAAEADLKEKRERLGLSHDDTLKAALRMLDSWIGLYKLSPMESLIEECLPLVKNRDPPSDLYARFIQSKAFMRYKQFKFQDSLDLFKEFQQIMGPSPELLENMGHTHNTLSQYEDALKCFTDALEIVRLRGILHKDKGYDPDEHSGGLHLGVGTTLKRLGKLEEGLAAMYKALDVFKRRFKGQDHSLVAKTLTGIADTCYRLGRENESHEAHLEAVRLFKVTCGVSPLTANALVGLGKSFVAKKDNAASLKCFDEALSLHVRFDTLDMTQVVKLFQLVLDMRSKMVNQPNNEPGAAVGAVYTLPMLFTRYVEECDACTRSLERQGRGDTEDAAAFYKSAGEFCLLAGKIEQAVKYLTRSIGLLKKVKTIDCSGLINTCMELIMVAVSMQQRAQPQAAAGKK